MYYKNISTNTISIKINKNYEIIAMIMYHKETSDYDVNYYLLRTDIQLMDLMYTDEHTFNNSTLRSIKHDVVKYVEDYTKHGRFDRYINRYEYMLKCFELGNEIEENKRLYDANAS